MATAPTNKRSTYSPKHGRFRTVGERKAAGVPEIEVQTVGPKRAAAIRRSKTS